MLDSIGTTKYAYIAVGQLFTEDGPFDNDTVTNIYSNRLRMEMDLHAADRFLDQYLRVGRD